MSLKSETLKHKKGKISYYRSKEVVSTYENWRFNNIYGYLLNKLQKYLISQFKLFDNKIGIDLATGTGRFLTEIIKKVGTVIGIDTSLNMILYAKQKHEVKNNNHIHFIVADIEHLPIRSSSVGLISAFHLMIHLKRFSRLFLEVDRILQKKGKFIFNIDNKNFVIRRMLYKISNYIRILNRIGIRISRYTRFNLKEIKYIFTYYNNFKINSITGIGVIITYLRLYLVRKLVSNKHYNAFFFKTLFKIEKFLIKRVRFCNYLSHDFLIEVIKNSN